MMQQEPCLPHALYLTRNGLMEPLGQSQVLAYLRGLTADHRITLVTFEKTADLADAEAVARLRAECESLGIRWLPQRFRGRPRLLSAAPDLWRLCRPARREVRTGARPGPGGLKPRAGPH